MTNEWRLRALCRQVSDLNAWFPDREDEAGYASAKAFCRQCPVVRQCLGLALYLEQGKRANNRHGMFGARTPFERGAMQNQLEHGTNSCYVIDLCRCPPCTAASNTTKRPKTALAA